MNVISETCLLLTSLLTSSSSLGTVYFVSDDCILRFTVVVLMFGI